MTEVEVKMLAFLFGVLCGIAFSMILVPIIIQTYEVYKFQVAEKTRLYIEQEFYVEEEDE